MSNQAVLEAHSITKHYKSGKKQGEGASTLALNEVSFQVHQGEFVGIMGPSGSGKSTLLNCIATIDTVTSGQIIINKQEITHMSSKELTNFRRDKLGFIFQDSNLLDTLTAFENIALALTIQKVSAQEIEAQVQKIAAQLSIDTILTQYPYQLSGGQKQRVAAARAVITHPHLVLADEPTGALDSKAATQLLTTLTYLNQKGATLLMVSHDPATISYCHRILFIKDGKLWGQIERKSKERRVFLDEITATLSRMEGTDTDVH